MVRKLFYLFILFYSSYTFSLELSSGIIFKGRNTISTPEYDSAYQAVKNVMKNLEPKNSLAIGITNLGNGNDWYRMYDNLEIFGINADSQTLLGHWPITRWSHEYIIPEITARLTIEGAVESHVKPSITSFKQGEYYYGCLSQTPLRYGDINNNGKNEIVLLMNKDVVIFSPEKKKVIFQLNWMDERSDGAFIDTDGRNTYSVEERTTLPQYRDPYVSNDIYKGIRVYAKFFTGEFNGNQTPDIIVWYKVYQSNMPNEQLGFTKVRDTVKHYELITEAIDNIQPTGEYLPLNTSEAEIRQWLTSNTLTWQKGYPNLSECAGQTTQHIPEMVDPLLNDPDVLK